MRAIKDADYDDLSEAADSIVQPLESHRPRVPGEDRRLGTVIGRYRIDSVVGPAALGLVYRASHVHTRKNVAIKILHPEFSRSSDHALRFEREAVVTGRINHPNVVRASDFETLADGSMYLVLEYVSGESLRSVLASGALPVERALSIAAQAAAGLAAAHALSVIHRSVKPENLLLTSRDGEELVKLADFGLAALDLQEDCEVITQVGAAVGTPEYMAPEQVLGQWFDERADLYSLGVVLFEMLAGRVPFSHPSAVRVLEMHLNEELPALPDTIPPAVGELVARLLAKQPERRVQSAHELLVQIENASAQVAQYDLRKRWSLRSLLKRFGE